MNAGALSLEEMAQILEATKPEWQTLDAADNSPPENSNNADNTVNLNALPDGTYFLGTTSNPKQGGEFYIVLAKNPNQIEGFRYRYQTDRSECFTGTANGNFVSGANVATYVIDPPTSDWIFQENTTLDLSNYQKLPFDQIPSSIEVQENLSECKALW
jgi:hypothetical protein